MGRCCRAPRSDVAEVVLLAHGSGGASLGHSVAPSLFLMSTPGMIPVSQSGYEDSSGMQCKAPALYQVLGVQQMVMSSLLVAVAVLADN